MILAPEEGGQEGGIILAREDIEVCALRPLNPSLSHVPLFVSSSLSSCPQMNIIFYKQFASRQ